MVSMRNNQTSKVVALSTSKSPDMAVFGLSEGHLSQVVAEFTIYLLSSGMNLAYGGDLRSGGFTKLLFELVRRYRHSEETNIRITDYLAWPVHISMAVPDLNELDAELRGFAQLVLVGHEGGRISMEDRKTMPSREPNDDEWSVGLTSMRRIMHDETDARIVLGGRVEDFKGAMPGIAEEALLSLESGQPTFLIGGFGGCTRDIAETIGLVDVWAGSRPAWVGRLRFECYGPESLHNGLSIEENRILAHTPHIDQAVTLVMKGLHRLRGDVHESVGD